MITTLEDFNTHTLAMKLGQKISATMREALCSKQKHG